MLVTNQKIVELIHGGKIMTLGPGLTIQYEDLVVPYQGEPELEFNIDFEGSYIGCVWVNDSSFHASLDMEDMLPDLKHKIIQDIEKLFGKKFFDDEPISELYTLTEKYLRSECDNAIPTVTDVRDQIIYGISVFGSEEDMLLELKDYF